MAADGSIKIEISVDGKEVKVASKELDNLEASAGGVGKGIKAAESSIDGLADSSAKASKDVKGAADSVDGLADSGSKASKGLKGADGAIDGIADSSASASKDVKGAADSIDSLASSGAKAGKDLKGVDSAIDGVSDSSAQAASGVKGVGDSLGSMSDKASEAAESANKVKQSTDGVGEGTVKASIGLKDLATSLGLVAIASAAFNTLKASVDGAIARFDTLNSFPKVLQALGVSAEDSQAAMSKLSDGIDGLPTTLNDIAASAQRMYTSFNDMDVAADTAIALNNAMLGSGSNAEQASRGVEQYTKALQTGSINMDIWNTLSETMDVGLIKIAEGFGYAGKSAKDDLYNALKDGVITLDEFNAKLIEVGTGTGIMAELAKENSLGIATSLGNLKNAAARGIANIIESFDKLAKEVTGKDIAQNIDSLKAIVNASFKAMGAAIEATAPVVKVFGSAVQSVIPVVKTLTPAIVGLMAAYGAYAVITKVSGVINASNAILAAAMVSNKALAIATMASATASGADVAAKAAQGGAISIVTLAIGLMTGKIKLSTAAQVIATTVTYAFGAAVKFLMGPVGWVVAGIGLLVTGVVALVKWFNKSTEEAKRMAEETESVVSSVDSLTGSIKSSSEAYQENQSSIGSNAKANRDLAEQIVDLSEKEKKSAADKLLLAEYTERLNESVEGLNLAYNEESNALNMSKKQLAQRLQIMQDLETSTAGQERLLEISKEQMEVDMQLSEVVEQQKKWRDAVEDKTATAKEAAKELAVLSEKEEELKVVSGELAQQHAITSEQITEAVGNVAKATQDSTELQLFAFAELSEGNKKLVDDMMSTWQDYESAATDMFDSLTDKSKLSIGEMQKNLEENQRVMSEWADNIAKLSERGIDEGLLEKLRSAGPESAGYVKELVGSSDAELQKLSDTFAQGGQTATDALSKALGIEGSGVMEAVGDLVDQTTSSLKEKIEASDFHSIGQAVPEGYGGGVEDGTPEAIRAVGEMAEKSIDEAKKTLDVNSPSKEFTAIGESVPEGMTLGISNGTSQAVESAKKLATDILKPFDGTPAAFEQIGKEAMTGFNKGLNANSGAVLATANSIALNVASTMRNALDIHSPSRVTNKIGKQTGEGFTEGIKGQGKKASKAAEKIAKEAAKKLKDTLDASKKFIEDKKYFNELSLQEELRLWEKVQGRYKKGTKERIEAEKNVYRVKKEIEKQKYENSKAFIDKRKYYDQMSLKEELAAWERVQARYKKGTKEREEAERNVYRVKKELQKAELDNSKRWVEERKYYNQLSLMDELKAWERVQSRYLEGTEERKQAEKEVYRVKKEINKELTRLNDDYLKKVQDVNKKLADEEDRMWDEFVQKREQRGKDIAGFASLFEEFEFTQQDNGEELLENLQGQVDGLELWMDTIEQVSGRLSNADLIAELQGLGPKALGELMALNQLTDEQLSEYEELYWKKFALARVQAGEETKGMRDDVFESIDAMRETANKELEVLKNEWLKDIKDLTTRTDAELQSLEQIGIDAGKGLDQGLASMKPTLIATATSIAQAIKDAMASALGIHSPSTVMRDEVGKWIPAGVAVGIKDNAKMVYDELERMADKMIMPASPEIALGSSRMAFNGGLSDVSRNVSTSNDNRKTFAPRIENHFTKEESSPAESTRKQNQMLKKLAMDF